MNSLSIFNTTALERKEGFGADAAEYGSPKTVGE